MCRHHEEMALRDVLCEEIKTAFERAGVGIVYQRSDGMPHSSLIAYLNYGFGGQRQAVITVADDGDCKAFMSKIYTVPKGKTGRHVDPGEMPLLFALPHPTPDLGQAVVRRIRQAGIDHSESIPAKLFEPSEPPIPLSELKTLGDLIDAYENHFFCEAYGESLTRTLGRIGKVTHKGEEWFIDFDGLICHSETAPGSKPILDTNGEPIVYTSAANIKLAPLLVSDPKPEP